MKLRKIEDIGITTISKDSTPVIDDVEAQAVAQDEKIKKTIEADMKEVEKQVDELVKENQPDSHDKTVAKVVEESVDVKNRKELGELVEKLKAENVEYKITRCVKEGFRYTVSSKKVLSEDVEEDENGEYGDKYFHFSELPLPEFKKFRVEYEKLDDEVLDSAMEAFDREFTDNLDTEKYEKLWKKYNIELPKYDEYYTSIFDSNEYETIENAYKELRDAGLGTAETLCKIEYEKQHSGEVEESLKEDDAFDLTHDLFEATENIIKSYKRRGATHEEFMSAFEEVLIRFEDVADEKAPLEEDKSVNVEVNGDVNISVRDICMKKKKCVGPECEEHHEEEMPMELPIEEEPVEESLIPTWKIEVNGEFLVDGMGDDMVFDTEEDAREYLEGEDIDGAEVVCSNVDKMKVSKFSESCKLEEEPKLEPEYDSRKSFYGKANVRENEDGSKTLISYNTPVCRINADGSVELLRRGYLGWSSSQTTLRHVKEFLKQNGKQVGSVHELAKLYPTVNESLDDNDDKSKCVDLINKECDCEFKEAIDISKKSGRVKSELGHKKTVKQVKEEKELSEDLKIISDIGDYSPWSGAIETWQKIKDADKVEELEFALEDLYPEGLTMTQLNDILWFESDWVLDLVGLESNYSDEDEEVVTQEDAE